MFSLSLYGFTLGDLTSSHSAKQSDLYPHLLQTIKGLCKSTI